MFVWIIEPPGRDLELMGRLVRVLRRVIAKQKPQDPLFTIGVMKLSSQTVFPVGEPEVEKNVHPSPIITVVCWHQGHFFHEDPDDDVQARAFVAKAVADAFTDFQVAIWFAQMSDFRIAQPRSK